MRKFERITGSMADLPQRATGKSAGYDIKAYEATVINPMECKYIPTGLKVKLNEDEFYNWLQEVLYIKNIVVLFQVALE